ncbi:hypothetical protein HNR65_003625 [Desulfosalsimonas propionicica]|uniref:Uncharacterized protein n=1 Tax=Desulfosalsimonas propionicica TaxID=332175 RepID=A0A7W0HME3_9BACT|nr:helix-turn-helix domain-containing protein [Desulfosalsimonas propionicica]MBA2883263.1 hypothetical protein [Desulfosalsimonas propionicica]
MARTPSPKRPCRICKRGFLPNAPVKDRQKTCDHPSCQRDGFAFILHRFLTDGFLTALGHNELLLYFFLVLVSDRNGLSFYSYDRICTMLELRIDQYVKAKDSLIEKDLIAFDGTLFQVLS